jgi:hypothetical protein
VRELLHRHPSDDPAIRVESGGHLVVVATESTGVDAGCGLAPPTGVLPSVDRRRHVAHDSRPHVFEFHRLPLQLPRFGNLQRYAFAHLRSQQRLDGAPLVHGAIALRHLVERQREIEDLARIDGPLQDQIDEVWQVSAHGRWTSVQSDV